MLKVDREEDMLMALRSKFMRNMEEVIRSGYYIQMEPSLILKVVKRLMSVAQEQPMELRSRFGTKMDQLLRNGKSTSPRIKRPNEDDKCDSKRFRIISILCMIL
jgi:hypothetical protein